MVAGIEPEQYATGREMSNQQISKTEVSQHKPGSLWENWSLPTAWQLHFFALHLEPVWTMAATSFAVLDSNGSEQFRHL